jgi:hypothetical protein
MTQQELIEWQELRMRKELDRGEYRELIRLNHLVMEVSHDIHNHNMMKGA